MRRGTGSTASQWSFCTHDGACRAGARYRAAIHPAQPAPLRHFVRGEPSAAQGGGSPDPCIGPVKICSCYKESRFTEAQIMGVLRQAAAGLVVPELCREHGISSATFYKWRAKYGGMEPDAPLSVRTV